jgi:hypothetical protein
MESPAGRTAGFGGYNFSGKGKPQEWKTVLITGNLFDVLGVPLAIGNKWPEAADRIRCNRVILSNRVWQSSFAGTRGVVGRNIVLDHATRILRRRSRSESLRLPARELRSTGRWAVSPGGDKRDCET